MLRGTLYLALVTAATTITRSGLVDVLLLVAYALSIAAFAMVVHERRVGRRTAVVGSRPGRETSRLATVAAPARPRRRGTTAIRPRPKRGQAPDTRPSPIPVPRAPETVASPVQGLPAAETRLSPIPERPAADKTRHSPIPVAANTVASPTPQSPAAETKLSPLPERADAARPSPLREPVVPPGTKPSSVAPGPLTARLATAATPVATPNRQAATEAETCEIVWWRGFVHSRFYAALTTTEGDSTEIDTSPLFRLGHSVQPEPAGEALAAHEALVGRLRSAGWQLAGNGDAWHALRFQRVRAAPQTGPAPAVEAVKPPAGRRAAEVRASSAVVAQLTPLVAEPEPATASAAQAAEWASAARTEPDAAPEVDVERCTIEWWSGFVKSQFYACRANAEGLLDAIELSPLFRWRGDGPPGQTDEALAAHGTLVENLRASGWEPDPLPTGKPWYAVGFRREPS